MTHAPLYGDIMRCFREMDVPGVDELTGSPAETRRYLYSSRLASSAAELNGGSDVMCESCPISDVAAYGGAEAPTEQLRGVFNRLLLGGVTKTSDYMRLAREDAAGKRAFNEYVGRVISQLSGGRRAADVAVFYPIETVWARFRPYPTWLASWNGASGGDPAAQRTDAVFMAASDALFDAQIEFSYLDDRALRDATIDDGALALGDLRRSVLIFPATEVLSDAAFAKIEAFVAAGGAAIFLESLPEAAPGDFSEQKAADRAAKIREMIQNGGNVVVQETFDADALARDAAKLAPRPLTFDDAANVFVAARKIDGEDVFFVVNDSAEERELTATLAPSAAYRVEIWDPATGEIAPIPTQSGAPTVFPLKLRTFSGLIVKRGE